MKALLRCIIAALVQFFVDPTEEQIDNELKRAFGLKSNVEYTIVNNNVVVSGDIDAAPTLSVTSDGMLHANGGDDEFVIKDNNLYVVE